MPWVKLLNQLQKLMKNNVDAIEKRPQADFASVNGGALGLVRRKSSLMDPFKDRGKKPLRMHRQQCTAVHLCRNGSHDPMVPESAFVRRRQIKDQYFLKDDVIMKDFRQRYFILMDCITHSSYPVVTSMPQNTGFCVFLPTILQWHRHVNDFLASFFI